MAIVYLIRHGETDYSQNNIVQGQMQVPLNSVGVSTIDKLGDYIAKNIRLDRVITSDLLRCVQTSKIIIKKISYPIVYEETSILREISLGMFEGKPMDLLNVYRNKSADYNAFIPEGGESFNQLTDRINNWFYENYIRLLNSLIVTHRGPISVIIENSENKTDFDIENCVLKQGNLIKLDLNSNRKYRIIEITEV
jgi:broad specificity phosphatase PhoE